MARHDFHRPDFDTRTDTWTNTRTDTRTNTRTDTRTLQCNSLIH